MAQHREFCARCGALRGDSSNRTYCRACKNHIDRENRRLRGPRLRTPSVVCARCREPRGMDSPYESYCRDCGNAAQRERYVDRYQPKAGATDDPRPCKQCGRIYQPKHRKISIFCSRDCKQAARNAERDAVRLAALPPVRICPHCAGPLPASMQSTATFCSKRCRDAAHRLQSKLRLRTGEVAKPGYLRAEIAIRDDWTCQIVMCGLPVDRLLWYPDPWSGSLDHVIPVSRGGTSDPSNLRLAHLICNQLRGNRSLI